MALESKATLQAAQARAEAYVDTTATALKAARANLQATLRSNFIAGTAVGTAGDTAATDVARLTETLTAANAVLLELSNQISIS